MEVDLAGNLDGISERFVPDRDPGRLIEVEHLARYMWAAEMARGRRVLDAGCGSGYGCRLLAARGATAVTGVDIAESVLQAIAPTMPSSVTLIPGDLGSLELPDGAFELVVCFEVIEHIEDPFTVLDELVRVLAPEGLLLISSPNRGVYQEGNPHHVHEFAPEELRAALAERVANVALVRQSDYIASALLGDDAFGAGDGDPLHDVALRKLISAVPGEETYTLALASRAALPNVEQLVLMTGMLEMREWLSVFDTQTRAVNERDARIAELEQRVSEGRELSGLLIDSEQRLAVVPDLEQRIADLEHALVDAHANGGRAQQHAADLDARLMESERVLVDVFASPSWQITKPLRAAKKLLRR
jgi:SAM-dependent methyltransferase